MGVFGLGGKTNGEDISLLFSDFDQLSKLEIIGDSYTNQTMGHVFVYFEKSAVTKAVQTSLISVKVDNRIQRKYRKLGKTASLTAKFSKNNKKKTVHKIYN